MRPRTGWSLRLVAPLRSLSLQSSAVRLQCLYSRLVCTHDGRRGLRQVVVAVSALSACGSNVPPTGGSVTSSARAGAPLATAARLDAAIGQAMEEASIPGAIVGIWGPAGDYVRSFGIADKGDSYRNADRLL